MSYPKSEQKGKPPLRSAEEIMPVLQYRAQSSSFSELLCSCHLHVKSHRSKHPWWLIWFSVESCYV